MHPGDPYMLRAIELARNGLGRVSPNPLVGCVLVREGRIIGEGWHREYGGPHAEVNAVASVADPGLLKDCDAFVSLEPCAHHGKTPPCTDLLIRSGVSRVYVANLDINPLVNGKGIKKMRDAGLKVIENFLAEEGYGLNKRFFTYHIQKRPYIILKWAETADGFIARENPDDRWISNDYSRLLVHKWRSEEDAIMVGANTVMLDDPQLNVREWNGKNPVRIVIDPHLKIPADKKIYDRSQPTIIYNSIKSSESGYQQLIKIGKRSFLTDLMEDLKDRGIQSVIAEGGAKLLNHLFSHGLWDEARVFTSRKTFGKGLPAPQLLNSVLSEELHVFDDKLSVFKRNENSNPVHKN